MDKTTMRFQLNWPIFQFAIRFVISLILFLAAISKLQMAPAILRGESLLSNSYLLYAAVIVESAVAVFALLAPSRWTWTAVTVLFFTLTLFASWAIISNRECHCFGNILPSGTSLPINIAVVTAMLLTRKQWGISRENFGSRNGVMNLSTDDEKPINSSFRLVLACLASFVGATVSGVELNNILRSQQKSPQIRFLLADDWVGKSWPIDEKFGARLDELAVGKWLVLVFRSDCEHCKTLAKRIEGQQHLGSGEKPKIVSFVAGSNDWSVHFGTASASLISETEIHWHGRGEPFVASPAVFLLENGKVVEAKDGQKAESLVERALELP